jgi:hypothetical protein
MLNIGLVSTLLVLLGITLHSIVFLIKINETGRIDFEDFAIVLLPILGIVDPTSDSWRIEDYQSLIIRALLMKGFAITFFYGNKIISLTNEKSLIVYVLLATYLYLIQPSGIVGTLLLLSFPVYVILGILILVLNFSHLKLSSFIRVVLYLYFFFCVTLIGLYQLSPYWSDMLQSVLTLDPIEAVLLGMSSSHLSILLLFWTRFIPIPRKGQTYQEKRKEIREIVQLMRKRLIDEENLWYVSLLDISLLGGMIFLNYYFGLIPSRFFISIFILVAPYLNFKRIKNIFHL